MLHFLLLVSLAQAGSIENLVTNGVWVYFRAPVGFRAVQDYRMRLPRTPEMASAVQDVSANLQVTAMAPYGERYCGFAGSSCWLAAACQASFRIEGPGVEVSGSRRRTLLRLDREGKLVWMEQTTSCAQLGQTAPEPLHGLYAVDGMKLVAAAGQYAIADRRSGLRMVTTRGEVLVGRAGQLVLLGAGGARGVFNRAAYVEATVDGNGSNVVYRDRAGVLHWVDLVRGSDVELEFAGEQPVLNDRGDTLVYVADGELRVLERNGGRVRTLLRDVDTFALGDGAGFAATRGNGVVRFTLGSGDTEVYYEPFPAVRGASVNTPVDYYGCPMICYGIQRLMLDLAPGGLVALDGDGFDGAEWSVRYEGKTLPLLGKTAQVAWFRVPEDAPAGCCRKLTLVSAGREMAVETQVTPGSVTCFSTWHEGFTRLVTEQDPAFVGETVHVLLTGLSADSRLTRLVGTEVLNLGPYPYGVGLQQLDLRVLAPMGPDQWRLFAPSKGCELPWVR
ncbi:MAG: hypothetical protein JST93_31915 [Acidobacteria bacterium]|nr:hypothetical protein [Acidobacteriota bacterium]